MNEQITPTVAEATEGHNNPPPYDVEKFSDLERRALAFADAAGDWKTAGEPESEEQAAKLTDFINGGSELAKVIDEVRKTENAPYLTAQRTINAEFGRILDLLDTSRDKKATTKGALQWTKSLLEGFLQKKQAKIDAEKAATLKAEQQRIAEAKEKARQAEARNDIAGQQAAEEARKEAETAAKKAAKPVRAAARGNAGDGRAKTIRTQRYAEITDINQLFIHFRDHPNVQQALLTVADAEIRAAKGEDPGIPGIEIKTRTIV